MVGSSEGNNHGNHGGEGKKTATAFPKTRMERIMRRALQGSPQANIDEETRDAVDQCTLQFAKLIMTKVVEECQRNIRSKVSADDVINAMQILGFDQYVGPLNEYLLRHRESKGQRPASMAPLSGFALGQPPATAVVTGQTQAPTPPQPSGFVLGQQPPCDVTEIGLHTDVYAVWPKGEEASTSSIMPPARDNK